MKTLWKCLFSTSRGVVFLFISIFLSSLALIRCGEFNSPFDMKTTKSEMIEIPLSFVSGSSGLGLDLATVLSNVKLKISGCTSGYSQTDFTFNGSSVSFYLNDTGCLLSLCSFTYNGENYPNPNPPCGVFNTSVGSLTSFTGSGGANPGGDTVYAYVSKQITGAISPSTQVEFYILENQSFDNFNLPITNNVVQISNSAPFSVTDATTSLSYNFKLLYPNPPPSTTTSINYQMIGSAISGVDYTAPSGTISIPANSSSATLTVNLINNTNARETQDLGVMLASSSGLQGNATYYGFGSPTVMITNSDTSIAATGNPGLVYQGKPTSITTSGSNVTAWTDASGSGFGISFAATGTPTLNTGANGINSLNTIQFNGSNYLSASNTNINSSTSGYTSKFISLVFKTASDISSRQVLYTQGNATSGLTIYIYNGRIYASTWSSSGSSINSSAYISASTAYSFSVNFNSTNDILDIYLLGSQVGRIAAPNPIGRATNNVGIGGVASGGFAKFEDNTTTSSVTGFMGSIGEYLHYTSSTTAVFSDTVVRGVHGYLDAKFALNAPPTLPSVSVSAPTNSGENDRFLNGFLISRNVPSSSSLTVYYTVSGTAVAGTNYQALPGSITIPAYATGAYTGLTSINDSVIGSSKTLTLTIANDAVNGTSPLTYYGAPDSATTNIVDYVIPSSSTVVTWLNAALGVTTAGGNVTTWVDQSGNAINATSANSHRPTSVIATTPNYINFNGTSTANAQDFTLATNALLDSAASYTRKTFAIVFRTGSDVTTKQIIYKQGSTTNGMNIVIGSGNLYFTGYGSSGWGTNPNSISTTVTANTIYDCIFEYDQPNGQLRGMVNGVAITASSSGVGTLTGTASSTSIGGITNSGIKFWDTTTSTTTNSNYLLGNSRLYELIIYNSILNSNDFTTLKTYLKNKYGV